MTNIITNLAAVITITVQTNVYHPKQYWHEKVTVDLFNGVCWPKPQEGWWDDSRPWMGQAQERDNPDVRVTEVRRIETVTVTANGRTFDSTLRNDLLSSLRERRTVKTEESWASEPTPLVLSGGGLLWATNMTNIITTNMVWITAKTNLYHIHGGR